MARNYFLLGWGSLGLLGLAGVADAAIIDDTNYGVWCLGISVVAAWRFWTWL